MTTNKPQARLRLSLSTSTKELSRSKAEQTVRIDVKASSISSSKPDSDICMNARWTALDVDNGIFKGAIFASSTADDGSIHIGLAPLVKVSYSGNESDPDLRKNDFEHFVVVPGVGKGELSVSHELSVARLFKFAQGVQPSDIKPGTQFKFHFASHLLPAHWWSFEDETEGKKLYEGIFPDEYGLGGMRDEDPEAIKKLYSEGWLYSYPLRDLSFELEEADEDATFTLTE